MSWGKTVTSTITRFGNLGEVFKEGESKLLNGVARLSVLYEDLRLEIEELRLIESKREETGESDDDFRVLYFLRRTLATLAEFRRGLSTLRQTKEFKEAEPNLSDFHAGTILEAERYFQENFRRIKELRNEFAGHMQLSGVEFATKHVSNVIGKVTWDGSSDGWHIGLECDFAGDIVAGAITSRLLAGSDMKAERRSALQIIVTGCNHAQAATCAFVHAFLWDRFGS